LPPPLTLIPGGINVSAATVHHFSSPPAVIPAENTPEPPDDAVRQIASLTAPFETSGLTAVQSQIVVALAAGTTVVRAAAAAGIHRTTIHNWLRTSKEFREAVEQARKHYGALIADQLNELSIAALDTLRQLLNNPETPPAVRLRAALAVLGRPVSPGRGWQLPESVKPILIRTSGAPNGSHPPAAASDTARNAPCPCGSGLKYKRCCGSPESALIASLRGQ
jgi:hypothetical protein